MAVDLNKLAKEAQVRYDKMKDNPDHLGDPDFTFSKYVLDVVNKAQQDVQSEARTKLGPLADSGDSYRKKFLAVKLLESDEFEVK